MSPQARAKSALIATILLAFLTRGHSKSIQVSSSRDGDPMLAIADEPSQAVRYIQHPVQYVYEQQVSPQAYAQPASGQDGAHHVPVAKYLVEQDLRSMSKDIRYMHVGQAEQIAYVSRSADQNEYAPVQTEQSNKPGYPAEVIYVGQNADTASQYGGQIARQPSAEQSNDLANMAGLLSRSSGLAATILTEVPVNEMPGEVLEKLKKEYGVKVVATRNYPGANLIINCEDYSSPDNSVCASKQPSDYSGPYRQEPAQVVTYEVPAQPESATRLGESTDLPATEQPQIPADVAREQPSGYGLRTHDNDSHELPPQQQPDEADKIHSRNQTPSAGGEERYVLIQDNAEQPDGQVDGQARPEVSSDDNNGAREQDLHSEQENSGQSAASQDQQDAPGFDEPAAGTDSVPSRERHYKRG